MSPITHGESGSVEYATWLSMLQRCTKPNHQSFHYYGGRGIGVCQRWRDNFMVFLADMGRRPIGKYSLDRIDNDRNYEPGNCRWTTWSIQCANRRKRTHCKRGHSFDEENTYTQRSTGKRKCRICRGLVISDKPWGRDPITAELVLEIRLASRNGMTGMSLAAKHGLGRATISRIIHRKAWTHV